MNANLLRAAIMTQGMTQKILAEAIGISENSLSRKITGKREFTLKEVTSICTVLRIRDPENIFFAENIPNMQRESTDKEETT